MLMTLTALTFCAALMLSIIMIRYIVTVPGKSHAGALPGLESAEAQISDRLARHVAHIALHEHNINNFSELERVARYLEQTLRDLGYRFNRQEFSAFDRTVRNIETEIPGVSAAEEIVLIGAHYDSVRGSAGANDNASGVAATLELARLLKTHQPQRTIRLVFFVNEEPPYFQTEQMGSFVYAQRSRERGEIIAAMLSLETIGYYSDTSGSQQYPFPLSLFYPSRGNFIGFIGNIQSRKLLHRAIGSFRKHAAFPSEGIAAPSFIPGVDWSDHWSFWKQGYPALMITDTAPFRYPHYHTSRDTPDKLDYERTARVVLGLSEVIKDLAQAD